MSVTYPGVEAVRGASLSVQQGTVTLLAGANGAGKSSFVQAVAGWLPAAGRMRATSLVFDGQSIVGMTAEQLLRHGLVLVPEGGGVLRKQSVLDNLSLARSAVRRYRPDEGRTAAQDIEQVFSLFPQLEPRKNSLGGQLSGGERQMLAVGRALITRPKLLILDEPSLGLAPQAVAGLMRSIQESAASGATVLLIEQNVRAALPISNTVYVASGGEFTAPRDVEGFDADKLIAAYLGGGE